MIQELEHDTRIATSFQLSIHSSRIARSPECIHPQVIPAFLIRLQSALPTAAAPVSAAPLKTILIRRKLPNSRWIGKDSDGMISQLLWLGFCLSTFRRIYCMCRCSSCPILLFRPLFPIGPHVINLPRYHLTDSKTK